MSSPTRRADAEANAARILEAGRRVLHERGPAAPFYEVAKAAGVGQATLYRHFPNKQALVHAIAERNVADLAARAAATGGADLSGVLDAFATSTAENAEVAVLMAAEAGSAWYEALVERLVDVLQSAAHGRDDLTRADLRLVLQMVGGAVTADEETERRAQAGRACELLLGGVATRVEVRSGSAGRGPRR